MYSTKISDPELIRFAEKNTEETVSVIVELSFVPGPIASTDRPSDTHLKQSYEILSADEDLERQRMDRLEREMKTLAAGNMVRLDTSQAFVVDLTPGQLRAVSLLPDVGMMRPNRMHHTEIIKDDAHLK